MKSQRVFILAPDTAEFEKYNSNRYSYIYNEVRKICGTTVLTSTFDHYKKKEVKRSNSPNIIYLSEPGYKKNISIGRVASNGVIILKAFSFLLFHVKKKDIILTSVPHNTLAFLSTLLKRVKGCFLIIDIHDLLPESLIPLLKDSGYPPLPSIVRKCWVFFRNYSIAHCDFLMGVSEDHINDFKHLLKEGVESHSILLGVDIERIKNIKSISFDSSSNNKIIVILAGTLGVKNDIPTVIKMLKMNFEALRNRIKFYFLGDGELLATIKKELHDLDFIYFKGRVCYEEFLAYLKGADIAINSFSKGTDVKYSYRVTDYLACEVAVLNNLTSHLASEIDQYRLGSNYEAGNPDSLYQELIYIVNKLERNKYYYKPYIKKYIQEKLDRKVIYNPLFQFIKSHAEITK